MKLTYNVMTITLLMCVLPVHDGVDEDCVNYKNKGTNAKKRTIEVNAHYTKKCREVVC